MKVSELWNEERTGKKGHSVFLWSTELGSVESNNKGIELTQFFFVMNLQLLQMSGVI